MPKLKRILISTLKYTAIAVFCLYFLVWISSPFAARHFLGKALAAQELTLLESSQLRYNPFLSHISIQNLGLSKKDKTTFLIEKAQLEVDLYRLFSDTLYLSEFLISGAEIHIKQSSDALSVAGFGIGGNEESPETEEASTANEPLNYILKSAPLRIKDTTVYFDDETKQHKIFIENFTLNDLTANTVAQSVNAKGSIVINDGGRFALDASIKNKSETSTVQLNLSLTDFSLHQYKPYLEATLDDISGELGFETDLSITRQNNAISIGATDLTFTASELAFAQEEIMAQLSEFTLATSQLNLNINGSELQFFDAMAAIELNELDVQNKLKQQLVGASSIRLNNIKPNISSPDIMQALSVSIAELAIENLSGSKIDADTDALAFIEKIAVANISYAPELLAIDSINISGIKNNTVISEDKNIATLVALPSQEEDQESTEAENAAAEITETKPEEPDQAKPALKIAVGRFIIDGTNSLHFLDQSVSPTYERTFALNKFEITDIDSRSDEPSPFTLNCKSNDYAKIDLTGNVKPFSEKVNFQVEGDIQEVSLPALSSYIKDSLGFELKSGQLDTKLNISSTDSELSGDAKLHIRGIDMTAANDAQSGSLKDQTAVPLNVALGMLKDKQGNIKLKVPMRGNVDSPSFGVESFFVLLTKKAVMSQTKSYLMKTFVPYASVVSVAMSAGEFVLKLRFEDLHYAPQQTTLDQEAQLTYAKQFSALMQDKEKAQVKICGIATPEDIGGTAGQEIQDQAQIVQLKEIAKARAEQFKQFAINEGGIESSRMLICLPEVDFSEGAAPRITISI